MGIYTGTGIRMASDFIETIWGKNNGALFSTS